MAGVAIVRHGVFSSLTVKAGVANCALRGVCEICLRGVSTLGASELLWALCAGGAVVPLCAQDRLLRRNACASRTSEASRTLKAVIFIGGIRKWHEGPSWALVLGTDGGAAGAVETGTTGSVGIGEATPEAHLTRIARQAAVSEHSVGQ